MYTDRTGRDQSEKYKYCTNTQRDFTGIDSYKR